MPDDHSQCQSAVTFECSFQIVIASLLGVFLAPALAHRKSERNLKGHRSVSLFYDPEDNIYPEEGSDPWKSVWDVKTGYVATKVLSKHTCIISKMDESFLFDDGFPEPPLGNQGSDPRPLPPRENRLLISRDRLQSLRPYGKRIQALCRGVPSYLAYPAAGSNFVMEEASCFKVKVNEQLFHYCH
ncbi:gastrokine-1-like isoform X1 [Neopsephotus bourkii]|uniref:gastrokine-1-like isoform X1 n=1 Tax=Neopsephotus bourkii TaxID=309878 RepID=UPI002AA5B30A|nr:gastrokine-1-like isoform X1 [Neopsephotus bourkii]